MVSAPKPSNGKTRPPSQHRRRNGRSKFSSSSLLNFSAVFRLFHTSRDLFLRGCLHSLITKHGTPKAKGAHPRLYAKQRPGPPGAARRTPFPPLDFCCRPFQLPILLRTASCVGRQLRSLVPHRSNRFANSRTPPTGSHISPVQHRALPKHKCGTCIRLAASFSGPPMTKCSEHI